MKIADVTVLLLNAIIRVFLLVQLLKETSPRRNNDVRPLKSWMDGLSGRVFLINANGLGSDFFRYNSTPFIRSMVADSGFAGVLGVSNFETSESGLRTILTGKTGYSNPVYWTRPMCYDTILDHVPCKCWLGRVTKGVTLSCHHNVTDPLRHFLRLPHLFNSRVRRSCLYVFNFDLDPVLVTDYRDKLKRLDDDLRVLFNTVASIWRENVTTYIVTSGRGSPVGREPTAESAIAAWGQNMARLNETVYLKRTDLTALLCVLLGSSFPTGLADFVPTHLLSVSTDYVYEWIMYTIKHFENVLDLVSVDDQIVGTDELQENQLSKRLATISRKIRRESVIRWMLTTFWLVLWTILLDVTLITVTWVGCLTLCSRIAEIVPLLVLSTLTYLLFPGQWLLATCVESLIWLLLQNLSSVRQTFQVHGPDVCQCIFLAFVSVVFVAAVGKSIALPCLTVPVVFWPFFTGGYRRLNPFVLFVRVVSGLALILLPHTRTYGQLPNADVLTLVTFLFLLNIHMLFSFFKRPVDHHVKFLYALAVLTVIHVNLLMVGRPSIVQDVLSVLLLIFSVVSLSFISGTLLERLMKLFLSLFVPMQMMSIQTEGIYYLAVVLQMFTWVFLEYYDVSYSPLKYSPGIFSLDPSGPHVKSGSFSRRKTAFFILYLYLSYFAVGHAVELHSYDFLVLPEHVFRYPWAVSYFLAAVKVLVPFLVPTVTLLTWVNVSQARSEFPLAVVFAVMDVLSIVHLVGFMFVNRVTGTRFFPSQFAYFVLENVAVVCVTLSYYLGSRILLPSTGVDVSSMRRNQH